jgi:hypothetical protein
VAAFRVAPRAAADFMAALRVAAFRPAAAPRAAAPRVASLMKTASLSHAGVVAPVISLSFMATVDSVSTAGFMIPALGMRAAREMRLPAAVVIAAVATIAAVDIAAVDMSPTP